MANSSGSVLARNGDPFSAILHPAAARTEAELQAPVAYSEPGETAAGGPPNNTRYCKDLHDREIVDTVRHPIMLSHFAAMERLRQAEKSGCLDKALDTAETIKARNNLERMLAHQIAPAHTGAMSLQGAAMWHVNRVMVLSDQSWSSERSALTLVREHNCEAARFWPSREVTSSMVGEREGLRKVPAWRHQEHPITSTSTARSRLPKDAAPA